MRLCLPVLLLQKDSCQGPRCGDVKSIHFFTSSQLRNAHSKDKKVGLFLAGTPLMADFGSKPFQDFADLFFRPHGNLGCFHHFLFLSLSFKVKLSSQYDGSSSLPSPILMFLFMAFFLKPFAQLIPSWFLLLGGPDLAFHSDHFEEQHHLCFL